MAMMPPPGGKVFLAPPQPPPQEEDPQEPPESPPSTWRLRDAALDLVQSRRRTSSVSGASMKNAKQPVQKMQSSTVWDVETCLSRLRRDKALVVRTALQAAAGAVVEAALSTNSSSLEQEMKSTLSSVTPLEHHYNQLQDLREHSLARAHDNKEHVKRAKQQGGTSSTPRSRTHTPTTTQGTPDPAPSSSQTSTVTKDTTPSTTTPSFSHNTPAAAATLDARAAVSRAVMCAAASVAFEELTPAYPHPVPLETTSNTTNREAVRRQAQTLGQRTIDMARNASKRSDLRHQSRRMNAQSKHKKDKLALLEVPNPFQTPPLKPEDDDPMDVEDAPVVVPSPPPPPPHVSLTPQWKTQCLPRLQSVLGKGAGHAIYYDVEWPTRHGRLAHLLETLRADDNYGPHLILTTQPNVAAFAREFQTAQDHVRLVLPNENKAPPLRVLEYTGSPSQRLKLRHHWKDAQGSPSSSFHVCCMSYSTFLEDYLHACQMPWQFVVMDEGVTWLAAAQTDPNSQIGALWERGIWNQSDDHVGLAGTTEEWDFLDPHPKAQQAHMGLTARHRLLTASHMSMVSSRGHQKINVAGLLHTILPHFTDVVRDEWDRSKIVQDKESMQHIRSLVARSVVVHQRRQEGDSMDLSHLAMEGLLGKLPRYDDATPKLPEVLSEEEFIAQGKISQSRRSAFSWFRPLTTSWLLYELGQHSFQPLFGYMKESTTYGHLCLEIVTASSTTPSGAAGTVSGSLAFRMGVRCGRKFGSEQGLRQHMAALHAPPGTWLCRACGVDCGTSQARTHHERSCGLSPHATGDPAGGATPTVGQGVGSSSSGGGTKHHSHGGPVGVVGKKPKNASTKSKVEGRDKDKDGSVRVPGYRGVWRDVSGIHFVKIDGTKLTKEDSEKVWLFDKVEEAARKHDEVLKARGGEPAAELNYKPDGTRIEYEEKASASPAGLGLEMMGGGASVVPALSVINIKDLPKDVKPLLRDPRQTSRTGGNSKRHVYAYRGVCRQARKGHDRWQSQISFGGTNHYLGTFDSEWDAAAIYAWAHLILYGEEATKKAQLEGEEAAAAYEQEKKDIAEGKIIVPPPKPAAKKKKKKTVKKEEDATGEAAKGSEGADDEETPQGGKRKKKPTKDTPGSEKKAKTSQKAASKADMTSITSVLSRGASKVNALSRRRGFETKTDAELAQLVSARLLTVASIRGCFPPVEMPASHDLLSCVPTTTFDNIFGGALLLGLSSMLFGWNVESFLSEHRVGGPEHENLASLALAEEYDSGGYNELFRTVLQGSLCVMGRASRTTERAHKALGLGSPPLGGTVGSLDCNIGGIAGSCSEASATIQFCPSGGSDFQFCANNDDDVVTLNGQRINADMGSFPLFNEDICSVGARVFVFLLPATT